MKLSEKVDNDMTGEYCSSCQSSGVATEKLITEIQALEQERDRYKQDSEMLNDLSSMLWELKDWGFIENRYHRNGTPWLIRNLDRDESWSAGLTPKEAIAAAIKQWRDGK